MRGTFGRREFESLEEVLEHLDDITLEEMTYAHATLGISFEPDPHGQVVDVFYDEESLESSPREKILSA